MSTDSNNRSARHLPLRWLTRDAWLMILARALRFFARGSVAVLLGIYLDTLGFSVVQIGLFISMGAAGGACFAFVVTLVGDTLGRRRQMVLLTSLMGGAGLTLAFTEEFAILAAVAFLGSFTVGGGAWGGPVQPLETASLPQTAPVERRTDLFAVTGMVTVGASALGALAAGLPTLYQNLFGISEISSFKVMFVGYGVMTFLGVLCYSFLSPAVEVRTTRERRWNNPLRLRSRRTIFSLAGIFSLDHFANGLVVTSLVALWFHDKFGLELQSIALIFAGSQLISAASLWLSAKLANRFGLINTMVFSHVPPTVMLISLPFLPWAWLVAVVWLVRGFFSLMDVPAKQSYTMGVVAPDERSAMAGINNVTQSAAGAVSPTIAGVLWSVLSSGAPFVMSGALTATYLAGLFFGFRNLKPPEEEQRQQRDREEKAAQEAKA